MAELRRRLPQVRLHDIYGLSETHSPATMLLDGRSAPSTPSPRSVLIASAGSVGTMCGSCVSSAESLLLGAAGAGTAAVAAARRVRDALRGGTSVDRQAASYAANAAFLRSLGHDPAVVLGPPPVIGPDVPPRTAGSPAMVGP